MTHRLKALALAALAALVLTGGLTAVHAEDRREQTEERDGARQEPGRTEEPRPTGVSSPKDTKSSIATSSGTDKPNTPRASSSGGGGESYPPIETANNGKPTSNPPAKLTCSFEMIYGVNGPQVALTLTNVGGTEIPAGTKVQGGVPGTKHAIWYYLEEPIAPGQTVVTIWMSAKSLHGFENDADCVGKIFA